MSRAGGRLDKTVPTFRIEQDRTESWGLLCAVALWRLGSAVVTVAWFALRCPLTLALLAGHVWLSLRYGQTVGLVSVAASVVVAGVWAWRGPVSFAAWVAIPWRSRLRGWWVYTRCWEPVMAACGLLMSYRGQEFVPRLGRIVSDDATDRLYVRLARGQTPAHVEAVADELAHAFGAQTCQVLADKPGRVWLVLTRRDRLASVVPALPIPAAADLLALPVGSRQDVMAYPRRLDPLRTRIDAVLPVTGRLVAVLRTVGVAGATGAGAATWCVRLLGTHILIAGATGAGKGSVLWSIIRAVLPGVRDGSVQLWVVDPKGGMELAFGAPLFHRFCYGDHTTTDEGKRRAYETTYAEFLEELVAEMRRRQTAMRGRMRLHRPAPGDPAIVVVVDELASLTAYVRDRDAKNRIADALNLLLSQGRAVGVLLVAAVQDPRKETVPNRGLFPTRIALRLSEEEETDLVLGKAARHRGAACHLIAENTPGIGYVVLDGVREPVRVRAGHVTDADIEAMVLHPTGPDVIPPIPLLPDGNRDDYEEAG